MSIKFALYMAVASLIFAAMAPQAEARSAPVIVKIETGRVEGEAANGVLSFKGIPFAAPPVGELRWRAPQPPKKWKDVRQAKEYGHDCMQLPFPSDAAPLGTEPAEDCLYVNVWRPEEVKQGEKLPVLVWIYGGGFVNGGSSPAVYDGSAFARRGLVFVSFNYRLGRFGFFAHPALTAAKEGPLGNYALMDQLAALRWVERNVAAFGGDAENVTIIGESAGGRSVLALMTSPAAAGLFDKAVVMSGGGRTLFREERRLSEDTPNIPSGETVGLAFATSVGIEGQGAEALAALRALPAEKVVNGLNLAALFAPPEGPPTFSGGPMIDNEIVTLPPDVALLRGEAAKVPLIIGTTSMDIGFNGYENKEELFASFGDHADEARAAYDADGTGDLGAIGAAVSADRLMHEPARFVAQEMTKMGVSAWIYRFGYVAQSMRNEWEGAPHATDIPFFFDTVEAKYGDALTTDDHAAAAAANAYIASFAKMNDPNGPGLPHWGAYTTEAPAILDFTPDEGPVFGPDPWKARLDVVEASVAGGE